MKMLHKILRNMKVIGECWIWQGKLNHSGYGLIYITKTTNQVVEQRVHRVMYEKFIGPIQKGLVLDHLCRNKACFRPDHLEPVSMLENSLFRNRNGIGWKNYTKTHCPKGHELTPLNVYTLRRKSGRISRRCKTCRCEMGRLRYAMEKQKKVTGKQ